MRFLIPLLFCFITSTVFAAPPEIGGCGPLLDGAIINTAPECLNDSTFLTVDYSKADDSGWQYSFDSVLDGVYGNAVGGTAFGAPKCLRFSYATSDENIVEAMSRVKEALAKLK